MKRYWEYFKYIVKLKWNVFIAGYRLAVPLYVLIKHDISKFLPSEFIPYAQTYFDVYGNRQFNPCEGFAKAWLLHKNRNCHHWQHWLGISNTGEVITIEMPEQCVYGMVADMLAMSFTVEDALPPADYYLSRVEYMSLHYKTKILLESILRKYCYLKTPSVQFCSMEEVLESLSEVRQDMVVHVTTLDLFFRNKTGKNDSELDWVVI